MKPAQLIAQLQGTRLHAIEVEIVTQARCDQIATMRRTFRHEPPTSYASTDPRYPWDAPAALDAPGFDCPALDRGRCS